MTVLSDNGEINLCNFSLDMWGYIHGSFATTECVSKNSEQIKTPIQPRIESFNIYK